jgi:hypothetical protein
MSIEADMLDPLWRIANLYSIKDETSGRSVPFEPRPEQLEVINHIQAEPDVPLYIIKSRRLGMSTALGVTMADCVAFNDGYQASLVEQKQETAWAKMRNIIRHAYYSLPSGIQESLDLVKANDGELALRAKGADETSISSAYAGLTPRGGTINFLWVSEWGVIQHLDPTRSREIRTGALPAARKGVRVVETTWMGGKAGDLWDLISPILSNQEGANGKVLFFPWHGDPSCIRATGGISLEMEKYFKELTERLQKQFSPDQKKWYTATSLEQGIFMKREYPSTLDEAFSAPVEGSIYGNELARAKVEGRITSFLPDKSSPVYTAWDLGSLQNTSVCYFQMGPGGEIRILDFDVGFDGTLSERVAHMMRKGFPLQRNFLPHDAMQTRTSGKNFHAELKEAGLEGVKIIPRTADVWIGINQTKQLFSRFVFHSPACDRALELLETYRAKVNTKGAWTTDDIVHDESSHVADSLRYVAEAISSGMVPGGGGLIPKEAPRRPARAILA